MKTRPDGFLLLYKPSDITSFSSLGSVKKRLDTNKVGHAGTLDKFAEGLLIALIGKMTKASSYIMELSKEYRARLVFGIETDTLDPEGETVETSGHIPGISDMEGVIRNFLGPIKQVPPRFSAVHVNGHRAHRLAREGKSMILKPREVAIYELEILDYEPPFADFRVVCSKGTYIRSLARDIARALGSRGHLTALKRTRIGGFGVDEAVRPDVVEKGNILSPIEFFSRIDAIAVSRVEESVRLKISTGQPLKDSFFTEIREGLNAVFDSEDNFLALVEKNGRNYFYKFVGARG
ncbi:MAG: tRNA pseudouridine(55) synthase TruB [Spirochaetota bacterium]